jgi:KUP system potassium uptake protein
MVGIATAAAVVASQALISGAFSLTRQAVQLGYSPRVNIVHTSHAEIGQIYIPAVNTAIMVACLGLVVTFGSAESLASTYGVALSGTMTITSILFAVVALRRWHWKPWKVALLTTVFLVVDLAFVGANLLKIPHGGWFPLVVGGLVYLLMTTWKRGRLRLSALVRENTMPMGVFLDSLSRNPPYRVRGTAVFLTSTTSGAPPVLLHHLKHNQVLHQQVLLMSVTTEEIPVVYADERVRCRELGQGFYQVSAHYGFMETPVVPAVLEALGRAEADGRPVPVKLMNTTFYLGRETLIATDGRSSTAIPRLARLPRWRKRLFIVMTRNAQSATGFFNLPPNRVVELGAQIQF